MVSWIRPVGPDTRLADQHFGNAAIRGFGERAVEGAKNKAEATATRLRREQRSRQLTMRVEGVEAFECPEAMSQIRGRPVGVGVDENGAKHTRTGNGELQLPAGMFEQDVLSTFSRDQQRRMAWRRHQIEWRRR